MADLNNYNNRAEYIQPTQLAGSYPMVQNGSSMVSSAGAGIGAGVINGLFSLGSQIYQNEYNKKQAQKQREWNEQMQDKANAFSVEMWNKTNEYNSPVEQVQRLKDAGLNPLYYGLDGTSANAFQSAQALGYDRASMSHIDNPMAAALEGFSQVKGLQKDIELKNAQIDKIKADTSGVELDNEFKDKTMEARTQAETLKNSMTKEQIAKIGDERKQIAENIKKTIAETQNEYAKKGLIEAQENVAHMQAQEIAALLPYKQLLMQAQTEAQKAAAAASFAKASIDNKLLKEGYYDAMIDKAIAEEHNAEAVAAMNDFRNAVKRGNIFDINDNDWFLTKAGKSFLNNVFNVVGILGEAVTAPLAGAVKGLAG